jgi:hypothetical protein
VQRGTSTLAPREGVAVLVRKKGIFYLSHWSVGPTDGPLTASIHLTVKLTEMA